MITTEKRWHDDRKWHRRMTKQWRRMKISDDRECMATLHRPITRNATMAVLETDTSFTSRLVPINHWSSEGQKMDKAQPKLAASTFNTLKPCKCSKTHTATAQWVCSKAENRSMYKSNQQGVFLFRSSGAVWESRWTSWAVRPNEPSGFRGRKELLNRASALVTTRP